jgi:myo-inositol-1(or 4)-monophosphatase
LALDPAYTAFAVEAALAAGRIHRTYFRQNPDIRKKGPIDLVTAADLAAERDFRARVSASFPDHAVLGEEATGPSPDRTARCRWIIDPLDGTTNFAHGLAIFCVSLALEVDGIVEIAVVYDPIGEELFTAERGGGARLNGEPIRASEGGTLEDGLLCTGFPYSIRDDRQRQVEVFAAFLTQARAVRRLGSAALDLCYVAAGRFDGFWEERLQPWDMAAGALILHEAGGRVTDYAAGPVNLASGGSILASNGHLHGVMLEIIREARG